MSEAIQKGGYWGKKTQSGGKKTRSIVKRKSVKKMSKKKSVKRRRSVQKGGFLPIAAAAARIVPIAKGAMNSPIAKQIGEDLKNEMKREMINKLNSM